MRNSIRVLVILAALGATACGRSEPPPAEPAEAAAPPEEPWQVAVEPLTIPATGRTAHAQLTSSSRGVILSWLEHNDSTSTLKFAERAAGSDWSSAQTVASSDNWFVSAADVPVVLRLGDGTIVATAYPATDASIEAYDLRLSYSRDDGKTWSRPIAPHHDGTTTQHGFATLLELRDGGLGLVWLDGRNQELDTGDPEGGSMSLYYTSFDRAWKQSPETAIDARVCECCQTSAAVLDEGLVVAFRDRTPREVRDINIARLENGAWTQPRPLHVDGWQIDACPVNGPSVAARGQVVAAAWFAAPNDEGHAFAAFSTDGGRSWSEPIRLDDAVSLGHVDIEMLDDQSAVASWVEFANQRAQLKIRKVTASGARSAAVPLAGTGDGYVSGYPRLAVHGSEIVAAWTESAGGVVTAQQVKAAVIRGR